MNLPDISDCAIPNPFDGEPNAFAAVTLVAHLRGDFCLPGRFGDFSGFVDRVRQGFFAINVLAVFNRRHGCYCVDMVRRGHEHRVDSFFFFEHAAEIDIACAAFVTSG